MESVEKRQTIFTMAGVMLAMLLSALDQTIVATAMPEIVRELRGLEHISWVFTAYMLASTVTVPIYGKLSDVYGRRSMYLIAIVVFLAGSVLSGAAQSMTQLILFRGLQGVGGGAIMVNSIAVIGDLFPPSERGKWQGLIGAVFGVSSIAGPLLGGWLTDAANWRWIFYVNLPLGMVALGVIAFVMPKIQTPLASPRKRGEIEGSPVHGEASGGVRRRIDYFGAALLAAGLVLLLLALVWGGNEYAWSSGVILGMLVGAVVLLTAFGFYERSVPDPVLPPSLFKNKVFAVSVTVTFFTMMGFFGVTLYVPLFAQTVIGVSATRSGFILTPMMLAMVVSSALTGQFISRVGKYKALGIGGLMLAVVGMTLFSRMNAQTTNLGLVLNMIVAGIGIGTTMPIFNVVVQSAFDHSKLGLVTASLQLFRSVGGTVGVAILGTVMNNRLRAHLAALGDDPLVRAVRQASPQSDFSELNINRLQAFFTPEGRDHILGLAANTAALEPLRASFENFLNHLKVSLADSIAAVYLVSLGFMVAALAVLFFLPEISLRTSNRPVMEEVGVELAAELGQSDAEHPSDGAGDTPRR